MKVSRRAAVSIGILWIIQPPDLLAQRSVGQAVAPDSVVLTPGARYDKGGLVRFFAGSGHRALWRVPINVQVADLSSIGGGLTPLRLGGGMTTRTLHVQGNDGKRYVCRSVDKYPGQGIDEELRGTIYEAVLQDQISAFHPSGALVLPPLLRAVDVLHVEPQLRLLPDDPRLGEFRGLMAGELVIIEERPDEGPNETPGFAGSRRIVNTAEFMDALEGNPRNRLDAHNYLSVRLIDLLVGDRDRSVNNWWWARFDDGAHYVWKPIPRDRDQAFIQLDGFAKTLIRLYEPRMVRFSQTVPSVWGLTRSAWDMDRPFLIGLDKAEWDSVVTAVQRRLSDSVIDGAVARMPPEHQQVYAGQMARQLKARRDQLPEAAERFYRIVAEYADVHATDSSERAVVEWLDDERVVLSIYELYSATTDGGSHDTSAYFRRTFDQRETREIRLYLHGGNDRVEILGPGRESITLRIIGGGGNDGLVYASEGLGKRTRMYDADERTRIVLGSRTALIDRRAPRPRSWGERSALSPDWGSRWLPGPALPYTSDLGILIYAGASRTGYAFLKDPYSTRLDIGAGYAPMENKFVANVHYEVRDLLFGVHGDLTLSYSGIETLNFYGLGNDTEETASRSFYKLRRGRLLVGPSITASVSKQVRLDLGPRFEMSVTDTLPDEPNLVSATRPYGVGLFLQSGVEAALEIDTRDRPLAPSGGVRFRGGVRWYPGLLDVDSGAFGKVYGDASATLSFTKAGNQTIAVRVAGEKLWGTFPYFEAAFLGGPRKLRGFRRERFAGDASVLGSAEFRLLLGHIGIFVPWDIGVFAFGDAGRVYVSGESPGDWHLSAGGGVWGAPLYRNFTASFTVARSREGTTFYVGSGFGF